MQERSTRQNVRLSSVLTIIALFLLISCKTDNSGNTTVAAPEEQYFADYDSPQNKWGFLDTNGTVVIPPEYDQVSAFSEGLAPVNFEGKWGYIDHQNNVVIPFQFRAAWQFRNGMARVMDFSGQPCVIYRDGRTVCPPHVTALFDFHNGLAVFQSGHLHGFIDTTGQEVIPARFTNAAPFENEMAKVEVNGKFGLIDRNGNFILKPEYLRVYPPSSGRILVQSVEGYHFLNLHGDRTGRFYRNASPYRDSVAAVADETGWYLIDLMETPLMETRYGHIRYGNSGRWLAQQANRFGILDDHGQPLTEFNYAQINAFSEGRAGYLRDDLWGFLDLQGNEVTPPQYGLVWDFHDGFARAAFRDGIAFINPDGRVPFKPEFFEIRDFSEGLAPFQQ